MSGVNHDDESRLLLGFLQRQRDAVLKIVEGLPEEAWQTPVARRENRDYRALTRPPGISPPFAKPPRGDRLGEAGR